MRHAQRAALGFGITLLLATGITALALYGLRSALRSEAAAREFALRLARIERLRFFFEQKVASGRAYLLSGDARFLTDVDSESVKFDSTLAVLFGTLSTAEARQLLADISVGKARHDSLFRNAVFARTSTADRGDELALFLDRLKPARDDVDVPFERLEALKSGLADQEHAAARRTSRSWTGGVGTTALVLLVIGLALALYITSAIRQRDEVERKLSAEVVAQNLEMERLITGLRAENDRLKRRA